MTESGISIWGWLGRLTERMRRRRFQEERESASVGLGESAETDERSIFPIDVPSTFCRDLKDEALQEAFHRLELPLRFLLYATVPGREPPSPEVCVEILKLWRQGLEREVRLLADVAPGTIRFFDGKMENDYVIRGRCQPGQAVRILIPCWRLRGQVIVRGEAEPLAAASAGERVSNRAAPACVVTH